VPDPIRFPRSARAAPTAADAQIRLTLHGSATLAVAGAPPARLERKQAARLAYLQHAGATPRGRLAGLLWPEATASGARSNLRQCLARLRRLAPDALSDDGDTVALASHVVIDDASDAGADLLEAHDYADCEDFSRWLRARVESERTARQAALMTAFRAAIQRGDLTEAQARADALFAFDGESEDSFRALMEVAYLRGDFAAAVRIWERCRELVRQLYGVAPSRATQALAEAIATAVAHAHLPTQPVGNLGLSLPVLYGRAADLASLLPTLHAHRLVTLIGIGGVGKTTLALAAAHAERERWSDGVWFVDLAPVSNPDKVPAAIAHVLGVNLPAHRDAVDGLVSALRLSAMLLVLDNAEHLSDAVAAVAAALVDRTLHLRVLVTSRQALRLDQEQRFQLSGLSAPSDPDLTDPQRSGALALFEARVAALDPRFRLTAGNAAAVAEVCRRLDGLPLAIELAAARVPVLGVENLRVRLRQDLQVIGAKATTSAPRHQTLRAMLDWTHALLTPDEQRLLRRLGIFVGGFTLSLAEAVACDSSSLVDDLSALIERSLVSTSDADPPRLRLLEVTRAYALEKLDEAGEFDEVSALHAHAISHLFESVEADLNDKTQGALSRGEFLGRLTPELDNLRAARVWAAASAQRRALGIGLAASSTEALRLLGLSNEALHALLDSRDLVDETVAEATAEMFWTALCAAGTHGRLAKGEMLDAIAKAERLYRRIGNPRRIHTGLYRKGFALLHLGAADDAQQTVIEMATLEAADWPPRASALRLNLQGAVEAVLHKFDESITSFRSAAALLASEPGDRDVVLNVLGNLCMSLLGAERHDEALTVAADVLSRGPSPAVRNLAQRANVVAFTFLGRLSEATAIARQAMPGWLNDDMLPHMLSVFAWLAYLQGRTADAFRIDGFSRAEGTRMGGANSPVFDRARASLQAAIEGGAVPAAEVARWQREGEKLQPEEVAALCVGR
jgi:predicted ATPase/DNA-binding SARP family transcriptional activator